MNFKQQSEAFIKSIQTRKRNPVKPATVAKYESSLGHALPLLGNRDLSQINNSDLKVLVKMLSDEGLSASTITGVAVVVKLVVGSAVNEQGEELYPRSWNNEFIDLPVINPNSQKAPVATDKAISEAISRGLGQDRALYALLAGTGLRINEARALMVGPDDGVNSFWDPAAAVITVRSTVVDGAIQLSPKTEAANRQVDLTPELNAFMKDVLQPTTGLVFKPVREMSAYSNLGKVGIPGFHSLRRFRVTQLRKSVPEGLIKFWIGHCNESVTDRYDKIRYDLVARKQFAVQAGLGFQLEAI